MYKSSGLLKTFLYFFRNKERILNFEAIFHNFKTVIYSMSDKKTTSLETIGYIKSVPKGPQPPKYQEVFGHTVVELAEKNLKIMHF